MGRPLTGLLDEPGSQTASAERDIASGPIHNNVMTRNIDLLTAFADVVGMADLIADVWTSSA